LLDHIRELSKLLKDGRKIIENSERPTDLSHKFFKIVYFEKLEETGYKLEYVSKDLGELVVNAILAHGFNEIGVVLKGLKDIKFASLLGRIFEHYCCEMVISGKCFDCYKYVKGSLKINRERFKVEFPKMQLKKIIGKTVVNDKNFGMNLNILYVQEDENFVPLYDACCVVDGPIIGDDNNSNKGKLCVCLFQFTVSNTHSTVDNASSAISEIVKDVKEKNKEKKIKPYFFWVVYNPAVYFSPSKTDDIQEHCDRYIISLNEFIRLSKE
jgi:hypothetical protein